MSDELTDDYSDFFDANGHPVRPGVFLTEDERLTYEQYFPQTTDRTATEEIR